MGEVIPGKHLSMLWHPNVSATQGHDAVDVIEGLKKNRKAVLYW